MFTTLKGSITGSASKQTNSFDFFYTTPFYTHKKQKKKPSEYL